MPKKIELLDSLLRSLIQEWGRDEVIAALANIDSEPAATGEQAVSTPAFRRKAAKPLAIEQVERAELPDAQKHTLREFAERFDRKQFLPSNSDVREFLIMMGERPGTLKDRSEAFRRLLKALVKLPMDRLAELSQRSRYSGPSQLGALSDAIAGAATSLSRHRETGAS